MSRSRDYCPTITTRYAEPEEDLLVLVSVVTFGPRVSEYRANGIAGSTDSQDSFSPSVHVASDRHHRTLTIKPNNTPSRQKGIRTYPATANSPVT